MDQLFSFILSTISIITGIYLIIKTESELIKSRNRWNKILGEMNKDLMELRNGYTNSKS